MKKARKPLSFLLALVMVLGMFAMLPAQAFADIDIGDEFGSGNNGTRQKITNSGTANVNVQGGGSFTFAVTTTPSSLYTISVTPKPYKDESKVEHDSSATWADIGPEKGYESSLFTPTEVAKYTTYDKKGVQTYHTVVNLRTNGEYAVSVDDPATVKVGRTPELSSTTYKEDIQWVRLSSAKDSVVCLRVPNEYAGNVTVYQEGSGSSQLTMDNSWTDDDYIYKYYALRAGIDYPVKIDAAGVAIRKETPTFSGSTTINAPKDGVPRDYWYRYDVSSSAGGLYACSITAATVSGVVLNIKDETLYAELFEIVDDTNPTGGNKQASVAIKHVTDPNVKEEFFYLKGGKSYYVHVYNGSYEKSKLTVSLKKVDNIGASKECKATYKDKVFQGYNTIAYQFTITSPGWYTLKSTQLVSWLEFMDLTKTTLSTGTPDPKCKKPIVSGTLSTEPDVDNWLENFGVVGATNATAAGAVAWFEPGNYYVMYQPTYDTTKYATPPEKLTGCSLSISATTAPKLSATSDTKVTSAVEKGYTYVVVEPDTDWNLNLQITAAKPTDTNDAMLRDIKVLQILKTGASPVVVEAEYEEAKAAGSRGKNFDISFTQGTTYILCIKSRNAKEYTITPTMQGVFGTVVACGGTFGGGTGAISSVLADRTDSKVCDYIDADHPNTYKLTYKHSYNFSATATDDNGIVYFKSEMDFTAGTTNEVLALYPRAVTPAGAQGRIEKQTLSNKNRISVDISGKDLARTTPGGDASAPGYYVGIQLSPFTSARVGWDGSYDDPSAKQYAGHFAITPGTGTVIVDAFPDNSNTPQNVWIAVTWKDGNLEHTAVYTLNMSSSNVTKVKDTTVKSVLLDTVPVGNFLSLDAATDYVKYNNQFSLNFVDDTNNVVRDKGADERAKADTHLKSAKTYFNGKFPKSGAYDPDVTALTAWDFAFAWESVNDTTHKPTGDPLAIKDIDGEAYLDKFDIVYVVPVVETKYTFDRKDPYDPDKITALRMEPKAYVRVIVADSNVVTDYTKAITQLNDDGTVRTHPDLYYKNDTEKGALEYKKAQATDKTANENFLKINAWEYRVSNVSVTGSTPLAMSITASIPGFSLPLTVTQTIGSKTFEYKTIEDTGSFVSLNGLTTFVVTKESKAQAYIDREDGRVYYQTVGEAVADARDGERLVLTKGNGGGPLSGSNSSLKTLTVVAESPDGARVPLNFSTFSVNGKELTKVEKDDNGDYWVAKYYVNAAAAAEDKNIFFSSMTGGSATATPNPAEAGKTVTVTFKANNGYTFSSATATDSKGKAVTLSGTGTTRTFVMPDADHVTISATFTKNASNALTLVKKTGGTLSATPTTPAAGATVTVTANPANGYDLQSISVVNTASKATITATRSASNPNVYTFKMPASGGATVTPVWSGVGVSVYVAPSANGEATVSDTNPTVGERVLISVIADPGKELSSVQVRTTEGDDPVVTWKVRDGMYAFEKPASDVVVSTGWRASSATLPYVDAIADWAQTNVQYCYTHNLMTGAGSANTFKGTDPFTRASLWTVLARIDGFYPKTDGAPWYGEAMKWAMSKGLTDGARPDDSVTRQEIATMLWRYKGSPNSSASLATYADASSVDSWATDAMRWAVEMGIITGKDGNRLDPRGTATRFEVATMLARFDKLA